MSFGYDARGNLTQSGTATYGYSRLNEMTSAPGITMAYDPVGRMIEYNPGTATRFVFHGGMPVSELNAAGTLLRRYVPGPGTDEPIVWYEGPGLSSRRWLQADERGSVVAVSDSAGGLIGINTYDEFGIPATSNIGRFQYTGQTWYAELGMYNYKARIYSPTLGRFMQTDPIGYADGMNWYGYVGGDPVNKVDPSGMMECTGSHINFADGTSCADHGVRAFHPMHAGGGGGGGFGMSTPGNSYVDASGNIVVNATIETSINFPSGLSQNWVDYVSGLGVAGGPDAINQPTIVVSATPENVAKAKADFEKEAWAAALNLAEYEIFKINFLATTASALLGSGYAAGTISGATLIADEPNIEQKTIEVFAIPIYNQIISMGSVEDYLNHLAHAEAGF